MSDDRKFCPLAMVNGYQRDCNAEHCMAFNASQHTCFLVAGVYGLTALANLQSLDNLRYIEYLKALQFK